MGPWKLCQLLKYSLRPKMNLKKYKMMKDAQERWVLLPDCGIILYYLFDFHNSDSSNTEDADRINRKGDEKKQKGLPNESLSSNDSQNTACSKKNNEESEREMTTGDLNQKESSLCTGK